MSDYERGGEGASDLLNDLSRQKAKIEIRSFDSVVRKLTSEAQVQSPALALATCADSGSFDLEPAQFAEPHLYIAQQSEVGVCCAIVHLAPRRPRLRIRKTD